MNEKLSERLAEMCRAPDGEELPDHAEPWGMDVETVRKCISLARRVEGAGIAYVEPKNGVAVIHERAMPLDMVGQRVALVPVEGGT